MNMEIGDIKREEALCLTKCLCISSVKAVNCSTTNVYTSHSVQYTMWMKSCDSGSYTGWMDVKQEQFRAAESEPT